MDKPLTYLNKLFEAFAERAVTGHDQLICLHIFNKFNRAHWADTVRISDRELQELCRLYDSTGKPISIDTIRRAKARLKLKGLIDFKRGSGDKPTEYRLAQITPADTPADTPAQSALFSIPLIESQEDRRQQDDAGARGTGDVAAATNAEADAHTQALPLSSSKFDANDIQGEWLKAFGYDLRGNRALELEQLAAKDYERAQKALASTKSKGERVNDHFAYFKTVYDSLKPTTKEKAKEKSESTKEQLRALDNLRATLGKS